MTVNKAQEHAHDKLQKRLLSDRNVKTPLPDRGEAHGYFFTEVEGVTVLIGPTGKYKVPAVRTYPDGFEAAINARVLWEKQKDRDNADPSKARARSTGHLSPVITTQLKCGNSHCPCRSDDWADLLTRNFG